MNTPKDPQTFVYVTYINSTLEKVWDSLTQSDLIEQFWGGCRIDCDWRVGSKMQLRAPNGTVYDEGVVLVCEPPHHLSYTFKNVFFDELLAEPASRVDFKLGLQDGIVKLTLVHDQFPTPDSKYLRAISGGWPTILSNLKSLLETGKPLPFVWSHKNNNPAHKFG
ncbi:MAG: SRPBCC family protein [Stenotrophobium sp.]